MTENQTSNNQQNIMPIIILVLTLLGVIFLVFSSNAKKKSTDLNLSEEVFNSSNKAQNNDNESQDNLNNEDSQITNQEENTPTMINKTQMPQPSMVIDQAQEYFAYLDTNFGQIKIKLFADITPITVNNFVYLAQAGFYDNLTFHRVIKDFMIQGGCPLGTGTGSPGYRFEDETNPESLVKGSLAMANSGPNTNGSQFFIVTADATSWLDGKHTHFGKVVEGIEIVDKIEAVAVGTDDKPVQPVLIKSIVIKNS